MKDGRQRTTIKSTCGFSTIGNPREARNKFKIHIRHCEKCKLAGHNVPEFNNYAESSHNNISASKHGNPIIKEGTIIRYDGNTHLPTELTTKEFNNLFN